MDENKNTILIVDDNPKNIQFLGSLLTEKGYTIGIARDGIKTLEFLEAKMPDLILLDIMMPGMDGYEVCQKIKKQNLLKNIPIIFLSAKSETEDIVKGFDLGGVDYVTKPFVSAELLARVRLHLELKNLRSKIEHMANHDTLTGLPTLRLASDRLDLAISNAKRLKQKVALLFMDLDGFKQVNDTYGHEVGDVVLQTIAQRLREAIREVDTACRIGGDEFLVLISGAVNRYQVEEVCQRLIESVGKKVTLGDISSTVGVSIGIAIYPDHASNPLDLRKKADKIMYKVKESGKNNYMFAED